MRKLIMFFAVALLVHSCGCERKSMDSSKLLSYDDGVIDTAKLLDFNVEASLDIPSEILTTKYIKLETKDNCFVGWATQVVSSDKYIFILEGKQDRVLAFDHSGKYVGDVGHVGRGPKEYIYPSSLSIDEQSGHIEVVDLSGCKINFYSLEDNFKFISSIEAESRISWAEITKNGNIICNIDKRSRGAGGTLKCFNVLDEDMEIINSLVEIDYISHIYRTPTRPIYKINGNILGYTHYESIVYKLTENRATPFYILSFGKNSTPPLSFLQNEVGEGQRSLYTSDRIGKAGYVSFFSIIEAYNDMCVSFKIGNSTNRVQYIGLWDKKSDKTYCYNEQYVIENMGIGALKTVVGVVSDYLVTSLDIERVKEKMNEGAEINAELSKLIAESKEGDNPILFLFKTKD